MPRLPRYTTRMPKIHINGEEHVLPKLQTLAALLEAHGYAQQKIAVEINRNIIPRSTHAATMLRDGDRIEIVKAIGGG